MGATDTMEIFFEKLNDGDRQGAVDLMDERIEMRVHVRDGFRTLRGVAQVGGWFLRADAGLKMVPGEVREMGVAISQVAESLGWSYPLRIDGNDVAADGEIAADAVGVVTGAMRANQSGTSSTIWWAHWDGRTPKASSTWVPRGRRPGFFRTNRLMTSSTGSTS